MVAGAITILENTAMVKGTNKDFGCDKNEFLQKFMYTVHSGGTSKSCATKNGSHMWVNGAKGPVWPIGSGEALYWCCIC